MISFCSVVFGRTEKLLLYVSQSNFASKIAAKTNMSMDGTYRIPKTTEPTSDMAHQTKLLWGVMKGLSSDTRTAAKPVLHPKTLQKAAACNAAVLQYQ